MCDFDELPVDAWERKVIAPLLKDFGVGGRDEEETNQEADMTRVEQLRALAEVCRRGMVREAEQGVLLKQLRVLFGEVPETVVTRIRASKQAELDVWVERVLRAKTLDQVFETPLSASPAQPTVATA